MESDKSDNTMSVENIHDKFFWDVYGRPDNAVGFLKDFLPSYITNQLDFSYIDVRKKSFLSEEYKAHYSDIVIQTRFKDNPDEQVFVYFLLEHKSYIPMRAPLQLLRYMVEQWYDLEKKKLLGDKLPPIIPVLIYQGNKTWIQSVHFHDFVNIPNEKMKAWIPSFCYFLDDTTGVEEEQFKTSVIIKCWHIIGKYLNEPVLREKIIDIAKMMFELMHHDTALEYIDIFMKYLANTDNKVTREDAVKAIETVLPERGAEMIRGWAKEFIEEGMQEGMQKGMQKGRREESRAMLLEAIQAKYNYLRDDIVNKINRINSTEVIKSLLRAIFQTETLDDFDKLIDKSMGMK